MWKQNNSFILRVKFVKGVVVKSNERKIWILRKNEFIVSTKRFRTTVCQASSWKLIKI